MAKSVLSAKHFQDEAAAFAYVEAALWPTGPVCPHCGCTEEHVGKLAGKTTRMGLYKCYGCKKPFTVRMGTIFESSHLALHLWLQIIHLMCASKKGIATRQIQRMLQCSMKTAWFLGHRIREAMHDGTVAPFGSGGGDVQADETFLLRDPDARPTPSHANSSWVEKMKVLTLVDRNSGRARSFVLNSLGKQDIAPILAANISPEARLLTDEAPRYVGHGRKFAAHGVVNHAKNEYVNSSDPTITTNHVEGYFSVFKRGMFGTYQVCAKRHLHRYVAEFDFRYSNREKLGINDVSRADNALKGVKGKRLTYRTTGNAEHLA